MSIGSTGYWHYRKNDSTRTLRLVKEANQYRRIMHMRKVTARLAEERFGPPGVIRNRLTRERRRDAERNRIEMEAGLVRTLMGELRDQLKEQFTQLIDAGPNLLKLEIECAKGDTPQARQSRQFLLRLLYGEDSPGRQTEKKTKSSKMLRQVFKHDDPDGSGPVDDSLAGDGAPEPAAQELQRTA